jgi:hypothetical protein
MHPSKLDDSELNEMLVGVAKSVGKETDNGNTGTDVHGWSDNWRSRGKKEMVVLIQSSANRDPLGVKKMFQKLTRRLLVPL